MDYEGRLIRARAGMRKRGIGLMYLTRGANLWYLVGIKRSGPELTDSNAYGDYVCGAYIGADEGFTIVAPRMGGASWRVEAESKPWVDEVRIIDETESPRDVMREVLKPFRVRGRRVSVDDRAWAQTGLLLRETLLESSLSLASDIIAPMRMIKDEDEIALMKRAGEVTDEVYGDVVDFLKVGVTEYDVAHEVDYQFTKQGAEYNSFVTGVRFSKPGRPRSAASPRTTPRRLEEGDSVTFDFGACLDGYCSDFGRTAIVGKPPEEFLRMHDLVMEAQAAAIERMVSGTIMATQLDRVARGIIEDAGYGEFFTHRLGHGIGVTVHEPPFLYIPDETVLVSNMTFTVEPSIRVPNGHGCRVEDVVMVTEKGGFPFSNYHKDLTVI